ncbi:MAG TPA: acetolactate synthase small subunit [bacterium]|nr:acetolactate synthase small subunit [bacterium]HOL48701.1 acetolactate synthase small subunit [bacterium]HPQ19816.1 acetolactate synthase small subunit [bacterium]
MLHTITVLVENKSGVLARIAGLFAGRGYNILSLAVAETENPNLSRMTITASGDDMEIEQICKQLNKLINVIKVNDVTVQEHIARELLLVKLNVTKETRTSILEIVNIFEAKVIDLTENTMTIQAIASPSKISNLIKNLKNFGIKELSRTGRIAILRG